MHLIPQNLGPYLEKCEISGFKISYFSILQQKVKQQFIAYPLLLVHIEFQMFFGIALWCTSSISTLQRLLSMLSDYYQCKKMTMLKPLFFLYINP